MLLTNAFTTLLVLATSAAAASKTYHSQQHQPSRQDQRHRGAVANYANQPSLVDAHLAGLAHIALGDEDQPRLLSRLFGTAPKPTVYYKLADGTVLAHPPAPESLLDFEVLTGHRDEHSGSLVDIDILRRDPELDAFATTGDIIQKAQPVPAAMPPLPVHARQFVTDGNSVKEEPGHEHKKTDKHSHPPAPKSKNGNNSKPKPKSKPQPKPAKKPGKKTPQRPHKSTSGQQQQFGAKAVSQDSTPSSTSSASTSSMDGSTSDSPSATASASATISSTDVPTLPVAAPSTPTAQVVNLDFAMKRRVDQFVQQVMIQRRHDHGEKSGKGSSDFHAKGQSSDASTSTSTTVTTTSTSSSYTDTATDTAGPSAAPFDAGVFDDGGFTLHGLRQGAIHLSATFGDAKPLDASASPSDDSAQPAQPAPTDSSSSTSADRTTTDSSAETAPVTTSSGPTATSIPISAHGNVIDLSLNIHQRRDVDIAALEGTTGPARAILQEVVEEVVAGMPYAMKQGVDSINAHDAASHVPTSLLPTGATSNLPAPVTAIPDSVASAVAAPVVGVAHQVAQHRPNVVDSQAAMVANQLHTTDDKAPVVAPAKVIDAILGH